jgi:hypothetical protein
MPTDPKPRQLYKQVPGTIINFAGSTPEQTTLTNGWEQIGTGIVNYLVYRTYIDLAGWSKQELTSFIQGVDVQKSLTPRGATATMPYVLEYDMLSTRKIQDDEMINFLDGPPGFMPTIQDKAVDLMELLYGECQEYAFNSTISGTFITTGRETWGSGNPTAMDKLHWTRLVILSSGQIDDDSLQIGPTNLVVQAVTAKEKDLVWMERLRRSYVLQDQADV